MLDRYRKKRLDILIIVMYNIDAFSPFDCRI